MQLEEKGYILLTSITQALYGTIFFKTIYFEESIVNSNPTQGKMCELNDRKYDIFNLLLVATIIFFLS